MKSINAILCISTVFFMLACKKDEVAEPTVNLSQQIAGTYKLTSVLRNNTLADVTSTATGSATITAKDNTTAQISYTLAFGVNQQLIATDYQISKNGSDFKLVNSAGEDAVVQGSKLKMIITFTTLASSQKYIVEYTK
ncbi:MAG: hypothetical protein MUF58_18830 [Arcicella sp.]|jgi:hypothetical protein|nr:hypothetical protein [Arcicella sp.]